MRELLQGKRLLLGIALVVGLFGWLVAENWPREPTQDYPNIIARTLAGDDLSLAENSTHPLLCIATETSESVSFIRCDVAGACSSWDRGAGPAIIDGNTHYFRVMPGASYRHFCVADLTAIQVHARRESEGSTMILLKHDGTALNEAWDDRG